MMRSQLLLAGTMISLAGCSTVRLEEDSRRSIRTVCVSPEVAQSGSCSGDLRVLNVQSRGQAWHGSLFTLPVALIIDLIDWPAYVSRRDRAFTAKMKGAGVVVGSMVREAFVEQLGGERLFGEVVKGGGDGEFRLEVEYGIADGLGAWDGWKPWLEVTGTLLDREQRVLWRKSANVSTSDERLPQLEEPFSKPAYLRGAYAKAARIVAHELLAHLKNA